MRVNKPEDATRYDPYGEMGHVKATTPEEAVKAYAAAVKYRYSGKRFDEFPGGREEWQADQNRRVQLMEEAAHCVLLTGFALVAGGEV